MDTLPSIVTVLAFAMIGASWLLASRMRLISFVGLFRLQSLALAAYAASLAIILPDTALFVSAALIFVLKVILVPSVLLRSAKRVNVSERLLAYVRPSVAAFLAAVLIGAAAFGARLFPFGDAAYPIVVASFSLVLIGFLLLVSRRDMVGQGTGFLTLENGIFTFGLALTHGMPLLVEIGIVFDVLVGSVLMLALLTRAQHEHASSDTDHLRHLTG